MSNQTGNNEQTNNQERKNSVGRPRKDPSTQIAQRRYNLALNNADFEDVKTIAHNKGVSFLQVAQTMIHFGIHIYKETQDDKAQIILRKRGQDGKPDTETQILLL